MFFSIAEPVSHFSNPPRATASDTQSAIQAMNFTALHWGLHAWVIYAVVGLALAFFSYNKKLPLTFRSLFYPFLGERIHGWWGHSIDILSVIATLFGLSTSLGLGMQHMNAGLHFLFGWEISTVIQSLIIVVVISIATISVVSGLDKGVKLLSQGNMIMALALMLLVFTFGPSIFLLKSFIQNTGSYLANFIEISTWNDSYRESGWQNSWTIFYWAWWIAWSPFVGSFIARISKGRTVKDDNIRVFWAFLQAIVAIVLLWGGGLEALQTAVIIAGIPFAFIILLMCYSLTKGLQEELNKNKKKLRNKQEKSYRDTIADLLEEQN